MADNLNTPSLPEVKPLSRRHVMAGTAAVLSAMTGAAMAGAAETNTDPVSLEQMAAMDFEPWTNKGEGWRPPTDKQWIGIINPHLINLRIAWHMMFKTKPELLAVFQAMDANDPDLVESTFKGLDETAEAFRGMLNVMDGAVARAACVLAAIAIEQEARDNEVQS